MSNVNVTAELNSQSYHENVSLGHPIERNTDVRILHDENFPARISVVFLRSLRFIFYLSFSMLILGVLIIYFQYGFRIFEGEKGNSVDVYLLLVVLVICVTGHLLLQTALASLQHAASNRQVEAETIAPNNAEKAVAIQILTKEENPDELRACLIAITKLTYSRSKVKIVMCVDGDQKDCDWKVSMFQEVFSNHGFQPFVLELVDEPEEDLLRQSMDAEKCLCLVQPYGWKHETM